MLPGIKVGPHSVNVIFGVDKKLVKESLDLVNYIGSKSPGDVVVLKFLEKDGLVHQINIGVRARPESWGYQKHLWIYNS
jgi:S1-C subfamily serine protease